MQGASGWGVVQQGQQKATESNSRQGHTAEITVVRVLVEVTTENDKKIESARKNLESTHKEKQDLD